VATILIFFTLPACLTATAAPCQPNPRALLRGIRMAMHPSGMSP
jgi:hypothetical protein